MKHVHQQTTARCGFTTKNYYAKILVQALIMKPQYKKTA